MRQALMQRLAHSLAVLNWMKSLTSSDEVKRARDRHPAAEHVETAMMLFEANCSARKEFHWKGQGRWAKQYEKERMVNPLHMYEFLRRLSGNVLLRLNDFGRLGRIGLNALVCSGCSNGENAACLITVPAGITKKCFCNPEFME